MPKAKGKSKSPGKKTPKSPKSPGSPKKAKSPKSPGTPKKGKKDGKSKKGKKGKKPKEAPEEASEIEDSQFDESECTELPESDEEVESEPEEELIEEWVESVDEIIYFAKRPNSPPILSDLNYRGKISWGNMKAPFLESLLIKMSSLYMPYFLGNTHWPDSIRKDFASKLHRFMAHLTDARYKAAGQTVLYVPDEDLSRSVEDMAKDKDLVERLEAAMVHWIRQIKEMLSSLDSIEMPEKAGPLDEINFWNDRCTDLSGVKVQLDSPVVTRMSEVLHCAKSSYLSRFSRLAHEIQDGSEQAESNKHYLSILQGPCEQLRKSGPVEIPGLLQDVLNRIRVIWINSPYYNTRERVTGMLRRVSTEVINLCQRVISIEGIFGGRCRSSIQTLERCIDCSVAWKNIYKKTARTHHRCSEQGWVLDVTTIFAELDAFTQRCKDLIEICNCQMYLNRMEDGEQVPLPLFGGARAPDVARNMREMERVFCAALADLGTNRQIISDNRSTQWLNEFRKFRMRVKDVELMLSNIIDWSFETVRTVREGIELLDCFRRYANRETIRRIFDMKTVQVFEIFADELQAVRRELSKKAFSLEPTYPYYAGQAHWAMSLVRRIQMPMEAISEAPWLPKIGIGDETKEQHRQLSVATADFIAKTHGDWASSVEPIPLQRLDQPLLTKSLERAGYIEPNFDRYLLKLFQEVYYWERLNMEIPPQCYDVFRRREEMRHLREARLLFRDRINFLSRKLAPGFSKLFWTGKGAAESFIKESRLGAAKVQAIVNHYKESNKLISEKCMSLAESWLINIDTNRVYTFEELQQSQEDHRRVLQHWGKYLGRISIAVLESIKHNVRTSLTTLSKIVNVDSKSGSVALIGVKVLLKNNKIELEPSVSEMAEFLCSYLQQLAGEFDSWEHIPGVLGHPDRNPPQAMNSILLTDEDANKVQMAINNGMAVTATQLQNYLKTWDSFRDIWEMDKDMFIKRYHRMNPTVAAFDSDIASFG
ncbi:Dynein-1-beta heavy chain, flagellar inner arm I1 complex [Amphibalanus amphitrite]|uniref:Dynein-1-beta heavy chain, flagellar inner arm I1 complex n=1 Tax=Amphibalanus amphitrite TaxID=1232801 RepID=A0A6A4WRY6_AMPAM|nr:Dynein-1-beta heavy chain, flagellar inner arm I1 complex [Amphibalanus amphitrite]